MQLLSKGCIRIYSFLVTIVFVFVLLSTDLLRVNDASASALGLPAPNAMLGISKTMNPTILKGIKFYPDNPLRFSFLVDQGDAKSADLEEIHKLIRYFLAGLTIPEQDLWVNLSPYEKDRIVAKSLGETELGKDMLSQDYILKQLSSSLTHPTSTMGKQYWDYLKSAEGKAFNKVWIVPDKVVVYENNDVVMLSDTTLKTLIENDYLAAKNNSTHNSTAVPQESIDYIRQTIIPEINKDINEGENFASLRQLYGSVVLALWFKKKFAQSFYKHYLDKNKISGIDLEDKQTKDKIFNLYVQAFEKGAYDLIRKEKDIKNTKNIKRRYFAGGVGIAGASEKMVIEQKYSGSAINPLIEVETDIAPLSNGKVQEINFIKSSSSNVDASEEQDFIDTLEELSDEERALVKKLFKDLADKESKPVIGRELEVQEIVNALSAPAGIGVKNSILMKGKKGVGKTILARIVAKHLKENNIESSLTGRRIYSIEPQVFIDNLDEILPILRKVKNKIIVFMDEFHVISRGEQNTTDYQYADRLKPDVEDGIITIIGGTTYDEYNKYMRPDGAWCDRFTNIDIDEPSIEDTIEIMYGLQSFYEKAFDVQISEQALDASVVLSAKYMKGKNRPRVSVDIIQEVLKKRKALAENLSIGLKSAIGRLNLIVQRWITSNQRGTLTEEKEIVFHNKIVALSEEIQNLIMKEESLDGEDNLITETDIKQYLKAVTGIDTIDTTTEEAESLLTMEEALHERIVGQDKAISFLSDTIRSSKAGLKHPNKPIGTVMFLGPTGVGKTEVAKALAEFLFGSEKSMLRFDMTEYQEKHTVARLTGAPPGYIGYEDGGQLTEAVLNDPYRVILFDELEKAHKNVYNVLLQVIDDGRLTDGAGKIVDFTNTVILMTSNAGMIPIQDQLRRLGERLKSSNSDEQSESILNEMNQLVTGAAEVGMGKSFSPEFLNRFSEKIVFDVLTLENLEQIARYSIDKKLSKLLAAQDYEINVSDEVYGFVARKGYDPVNGARPLGRAIDKHITKDLTRIILEMKSQVKGNPGGVIHIGFEDGKPTFSTAKKERDPSFVKVDLPQNELGERIKVLLDKVETVLDGESFSVSSEEVGEIFSSEFGQDQESEDYGSFHAKTAVPEEIVEWNMMANNNIGRQDKQVKEFQNQILELLSSETKKKVVKSWIKEFTRWAKEGSVGSLPAEFGFQTKEGRIVIAIRQRTKISESSRTLIDVNLM